MNRKKAMEKVERIVSQAEKVPFVKRIVLFGSLAKEAGEVNGVDLLPHWHLQLASLGDVTDRY